MKINLKGKNGFTSIDLTISMLVVIVFVALMSSVSYNVYLASMEARRTATALNYAVDIFEHIGVLNFQEVTTALMEDFGDFEETSKTSETVEGSINGYDITLTIQGYGEDNYDGTNTTLDAYTSGDYIKVITLTITFKVSSKTTESIEMQRIKNIND